MKRVISLLLVLVMLCSTFAGLQITSHALSSSDKIGGNVFYTFDSSTGLLTISGRGTMWSYSSSSYSSPFYYQTAIKTVVIDSGVTSIGNYTFYCCSGLKSITIPDSVTRIGDYAFYDCYGLTSVTIGNSVTSIGDDAFSGCSSLTSITIPDSVTSIGDWAFSGCSGLTRVNISDIAAWCQISFGSSTSNPLYDAHEHDLYLSGELITDLMIPDSVTSIGSYAFYYCSSLTSITIPDSVTSIDDFAFYNCTGLTSADIGNSVTSIGDWAFSGCSGLTSITIPDSVTSIGEKAFSGCSGLTSITIPDSVTSIGDSAFSGCSGLTSIAVASGNTTYDNRNGCNAIIKTATNDLVAGCKNTIIPNSVTSIGGYAFSGCSGLTSITIPDSVTSIGGYAFNYCSGLTSITIPDSVTSIGDSAFRGCSGLTSITIPDSVTSIGASAFEYCSSLTSITIPDSVTSIGYAAFSGCSGLTSVTVGNSVTSIGNSAFSGCSGLKSVTIPDSVTSIGSHAFYDCSGLTNVTIGNSVTSIGAYTFDGCSGLTSITIPDSVTSIGENAFKNCSNLSRVEYRGTHKEWSTISIGSNNGKLSKALFCPPSTQGSCGTNVTYSYTYTNNTGVLTISGTGKMADYFSASSSPFYHLCVNNLIIENGVTGIGKYAFNDCDNLTSITIPDSVTSIGDSAFSVCSSLTSVTIGNSVTSIGDSAFYKCSGLTNVTIGNSVTSIGAYAFYGCSSLKNLFIGKSITCFGTEAFDGTAISDIFFSGRKADWNESYDRCFFWVEPFGILYNYSMVHFDYVAHEHVFDSGKVIKAPTCLEAGTKTFTCTICGYAQTKTLSPTGIHEFVNGYCNFCGEKDADYVMPVIAGTCTKTVSINAYGKYYASFTPPKSGKITFYSTGNNDTLGYLYDSEMNELAYNDNGGSNNNFALSFLVEADKEYILACEIFHSPATGTITFSFEYLDHIHEYTGVVTPPTCTQKGYTTYTCLHCSDSYVTDSVNALGHRYAAGEQYCQNGCGTENPDYVPPHVHSYTLTVTKPTCTKQGFTTHTCPCGESYIDSYTSALGHNASKQTVIKPTGTQLGYTEHSCSRCGELQRVDTYTAPIGKLALKHSARTANAIKVQWNTVKSTTGYQVQISSKDGKKWSTYATLKAGITSYTFKKLAAGNNYKFRVRFYINAPDGKNYFSPWSATLNSPTLPGGTALTKLTPAKKAFTAQWKKNATVNGYQVQYSLKANFAGAKTITVKNPKLLKATASKLYAGKYYFVRIRTYKNIGKANYFSTWSKTYKVKTK